MKANDLMLDWLLPKNQVMLMAPNTLYEEDLLNKCGSARVTHILPGLFNTLSNSRQFAPLEQYVACGTLCGIHDEYTTLET